MIKRLVRRCTELFTKTGLFRPRIILQMDGGICSQMHFYLVGKVLEKAGNRVEYDLSWYKKTGKDLDGKFARNYDLEKLFPHLEINTQINPFLRRLYISSFYHKNEYFSKKENPLGWMSLHAPLFLSGYFRDCDEIYGRLFNDIFKADLSVLDPDNRTFLNKIEIEENGECVETVSRTCAIHIRRGDLSKYNEAYGMPATLEYFREGVKAVKAENGENVRYFVFSDEPSWCIDNIVPFLGISQIETIGHNGSEKGYMDLLLMSRCRNIITSQGSMGKYAALLRPEDRKEGLVVLPDTETGKEWERRFVKSVLIKF